MKKTLLPLALIFGIVTSILAQYNHDYCPCQEEETPFDIGKVLQQTSTQSNAPIIPGYIGFTASTTPTISTQNIFKIEEKSERINLSITLEEMLAQLEAETEEIIEEQILEEPAMEIDLEELVQEEDNMEDLEEDDFEEADDDDGFIDTRKRKKNKGFVRIKSPKRTKRYSGKCPKFW